MDSVVDEHDIAELISKATGIPVSRMFAEEAEKLLNMEATLHNRVVGQQVAIDAVSEAIRRARAGLKDPQRPIGSFLFLGPTGVGKTELARALAEFLFDDADALVRVDMSEYMEKHSVASVSLVRLQVMSVTTRVVNLTEAVRRSVRTGLFCWTR